MEDVRFYSTFDPENIDHYNKFPNQTRNPIDAVYEDDEMFLVLKIHNLNFLQLKIENV